MFKAIDYVLDQMSQQGIRVIVAFIDYWKQTDGVQQARLSLPDQAHPFLLRMQDRVMTSMPGASGDLDRRTTAQKLPCMRLKTT